MLNILNLGAGVQSTTLLLQSCLGELPKLDCAIFADTGWEPQEVYKHLEWLTEFAARHGVQVHRVTLGNIRQDATDSQKNGGSNGANGRWGSMPYFVLNPDGTHGLVKRQCTSEYKIVPIERFIKTEILKLPRKARWPTTHTVRRWYGISADELGRVSAPVRTTRKKVGTDLLGEPVYESVLKPLAWCSNYYPLIGVELRGTKHERAGDAKPMTRQDCHNWLSLRGYSAPRSACIGCPYHGNDEWLHLKRTSPKEFEDACQFDETMRNCAGMRGQLFLHTSCKPLREIDFEQMEANGIGCESGFCFT